MPGHPTAPSRRDGKPQTREGLSLPTARLLVGIRDWLLGDSRRVRVESLRPGYAERVGHSVPHLGDRNPPKTEEYEHFVHRSGDRQGLTSPVTLYVRCPQHLGEWCPQHPLNHLRRSAPWGRQSYIGDGRPSGVPNPEGLFHARRVYRGIRPVGARIVRAAPGPAAGRADSAPRTARAPVSRAGTGPGMHCRVVGSTAARKHA